MAGIENQTLHVIPMSVSCRIHWLGVVLLLIDDCSACMWLVPVHCDILAPAHVCPAPLMVATILFGEACSLVELLHTITFTLPSNYSNFGQHSVPACAPYFSVCALCVQY